MSIQSIWLAIQAGITGIGAWLATYLGGLDGLVYALIVFAFVDYVTGVLAAIADKRLSSAVGFKGIARKILIFALVGLAHLIDIHILGTPGMLRAAVIFFYLSNEGISLIENATRLGLPVPAQMRDTLEAIAHRAEKHPPHATTTTATVTTSDKENHA